MLFAWVVGIIVIAAIVVMLYSDQLGAKRKHSTYFQQVQKRRDKAQRAPNIPDTSRYDKFYSRMNTI